MYCFIITACDQQSRSRHSADRLDRRIRIGSLGVIVIFHAVPLRYKFDPVLYCLEFPTASRIFRMEDSGTPIAQANGSSSHYIFIIMTAKEI